MGNIVLHGADHAPIEYTNIVRILRPYIDDGTIKLPARTADLYTRTERFISEVKAAPKESTLRDALVDALANGDDVTEADYVEIATADLRRDLMVKAAYEAGRQTVRSMTENCEEILEQIDAAIVSPALATLTEAAESIASGEDASTLIRERRMADAERLAAAQDPAMWRQLEIAESARSWVVAGIDNRRTTNWPWVATSSGGLLPLSKIGNADRWLDLLRAGAEVLPYVRRESHPAAYVDDNVDASDVNQTVEDWMSIIGR